MAMPMKFLGGTGLKVSTLGFGSATFGGSDEYYKAHGGTQVEEARALIDLCLEAGVNFFDSSNVYSAGMAEEILGRALGDRRPDVIVGTKLRYPVGDGPNDAGLSRHHVIRACEDSLRRLGTDYIDLLQLHEFDAATPLEETLSALDDLVHSGKVRYLGVSNFSAWMIMKALTISERRGWQRIVASQVSYSLIERDVEVELLPLGRSEGVGTVVWGPLAGGLLTGKWRRDAPPPEGSRRAAIGDLTPIDEERAYRIVDVAEAIAQARGVSISQVAVNWIRARPGVTSVMLGARNERQLLDNLGAAEWELEAAEVAALDEASALALLDPH